MRHDTYETAQMLIDSTIKVIARDGFDKASTRNITGECGLADAYIYHCFNDKEDLFHQAFKQKDKALAEKVLQHLPILSRDDAEVKTRFALLFDLFWRFMLDAPDTCRFYVQYYFSPYYQKLSAEEHQSTWQPVLDKVTPLFKDPADVKPSMRLVLNNTTGLAIKKLTLGTPGSETETYFPMVYSLLAPYLKE